MVLLLTVWLLLWICVSIPGWVCGGSEVLHNHTTVDARFNTRVGARWFSDEDEIEDDDYVSIPVWVRGGSFA